jgi:uncharacterized protein YkwD
MTTVKAPTFAASVNRLIVARAKLPGDAPPVDSRVRLVPLYLAFAHCVAVAAVAVAIASAALLCSCAPATGERPGPNGVREGAGRSPGDARARPSATVAETWSFPRETRSPSPRAEAGDFAYCGEGDVALDRVATRLARREAEGAPPYDTEQLSFVLRAEGEPHVWPHSWTLSGSSLDVGDARARLERWLATFSDGGTRRCGVASTHTEHGAAVAAVVVDAHADLSSLPMRAHLGQWLVLDAKLLVPASAAKVVLLGPRGAPRNVPTTLHDGDVRASFSVDRAGVWTVQVLANGDGGPRPVLEALLFVDTVPTDPTTSGSVPGEEAAEGAPDERLAVMRMVNAAREDESIAPLSPNPELDGLALAHAKAMQASQRLAHDAGDGDPSKRLAGAGLTPRRFGENVAHATTVERAHRVLWQSPSHRENLVDPGFRSLGVGVVDGSDGVWVCELFADFAAAGTTPTVSAPME